MRASAALRLARAISAAMTAQTRADLLTNESLVLAQTVQILCQLPPSVWHDPAGRQHMFGQHRGLEVPPDSHYDSPRKRVAWRKAPSADISSTQPRWDPATDIGRYQSLLIVALHTPVSTRVPELLAEKEPIRTFVEASIKSHCSNAQFARKMASPSVAHRLQDHINRVISAGQPLVYAAQRDPTNRQKHQVVVDLVQQCFTGIRCVDKLTNAEGVLRSEAERLKKLVATLKITNPLDYVADVDVAMTQCIQLWGPTQVANLCTSGVLALLLPEFVSRLEPNLQERALRFYNSVLHTYTAPEMAAHAPPSIRNAIERLYTHQTQLMTEQPDYSFLAAFPENGADPLHPNLISQLTQLEPAVNVNSRLLTVPDDLHFLAAAGLLTTHWRPLIGTLLTGYARPPSTDGPSLSMPGTLYGTTDADDGDSGHGLATEDMEVRSSQPTLS